ncbi:MAG TPA: hypothetical protein PKA53_11420, partial [Sphingobacterium sp.]|nr:hypothetical protein [Sphingobacterium sp.]
MNFDEIKEKWDQQNGDSIQIKEESIKKTTFIIERIKKEFKWQPTLFVLTWLLLLINLNFTFEKVTFEKVTLEMRMLFFFLLFFQFIMQSVFYYARMFSFIRMTKDDNLYNSRENLLKIYYELKFVIESHKSMSYVTYPPFLVVISIYIGRERAHDWIIKLADFSNTLHNDPFFLLWS